MKLLSRDSLQKIARWLLALTGLLGAATIFLAAYVLVNGVRIRSLESTLLQEKELQEELLRAQPSYFGVYPHSVPDIGVVLNPGMVTTTWKGGGDEPYFINSLGLRGQEIRPRRPGTTRILLVGDSVCFGWKLADQDRITARMQERLSASGRGVQVEFLTIAIPTWNIWSERAFLDSHIDLLTPDLVIWSMLRNDIDDVFSAYPPGTLSDCTSPQRSGRTPFAAHADYQRDLAMPSILERWDQNIDLIRDFEKTYRVPVLLLSWHQEFGPFLDLLLERHGYHPPQIVIPDRYGDDPAWGISDRDLHPSPWATRILALGLLDRLGRLGAIPEPDLTSEEKGIAQAFRAVEDRHWTAQERASFIAAGLRRIPERYVTRDRASEDAVLYGLAKGWMQQEGALLLRNRSGAGRLRLTIKVPAGPPAGPARTCRITVLDREGERRQVSVPVPGGEQDIDLELPDSADPEPCNEVRWEFDFLICDGPTSCHCARLLAAEYLD
jgi:hypothetical protein